jgi:hypothetical protein
MTWGHKTASVLTLLIGACSSADQAAGGDPYESAESGLSSNGDRGGDGDGDGESGQGEDGPGGPADFGAADTTCDAWAQDCPADEKCTWEKIEGVARTRCVRLEPDAKLPGEPCTVFGDPDSGYDDCELGALCHHLDARNQGMCMALCGGSPLEPSCAQPDALCQPCPDCPSLCVPLCNPLAQDCADGFACLPDMGSFACHPNEQVGRGTLGSACEYTFQCQVGFACIDALAVPGCNGVACCSPFCSTSEPVCPQGMTCMPWFDVDPAPLPNLGICKAP